MRPQSLAFPWVLIFVGTAIAINCGYDGVIAWLHSMPIGNNGIGFAIGSLLAVGGALEMRTTEDHNESVHGK